MLLKAEKLLQHQSLICNLVSPQTKMYFKQFEEAGAKVGKPVVQIPPQAIFQFQWELKKWLI